MMGDQSHFVCITLFLFFLHFLGFCYALPLCTDSRAPFSPRSRVQFCSYNVTTCCNYAEDSKLKQQFDSMNVSDSSCASLLKAILCARCDPFSGEIFRVDDSVPRLVPVLCNSTNFCSQVWNTCQNVSILNSPFASSVQGRAGVATNSNLTKLNDLWESQTDFCGAFGGSSDDGLACFDGGPVTLNDTGNPIPPSGMCLEKIGNGSYLNIVAHPDGSNRVFLSSQKGKIWLATIPEQGSGGTLELNEANPFLDLTDEVLFDTELGLLGIAFHPKFTENGRFFVSFNCDRSKWASCAGRCACNSDVDCDPSSLPADNGAQPCQYQSVIAEFTVNGTSSQPALATVANPSEVRRIFTMGLPFTTHHAGQILFGPKDGYLYFMMGDGGGTTDDNSDPYNLAQNKKSLLGKILRLDIDKTPNGSEVGLWGNYSIPMDNPYTIDRALQKEIWALGLRNPWRCSFDSARPSYFLCGDVGQNAYEEVDLISKGGNYGWRAYEGPYPYGQSPAGMRSIFPVMGYNHSEVRSSTMRSASITGGYFYRATTNPCLQGRYLFADLFGSATWVGTENPINSGKFDSTKINVSCADDSPLRCTDAAGNQVPLLNFIFSFGEDNNKDVFLLTDNGVYRIVRPSRCNHACANEGVLPPPPPPPPPPTPSLSEAYHILRLVVQYHICLLLLISFLIWAV